MAYNFFEFNRDQGFLLPENMLDWLPEGDLAHFVIEVADKLDLSEFLSRYRTDGWGASAYHPRMMVALILYAYCLGQRSSRAIEKLCARDVGFRVVAGGCTPDHSTVSRFRKDNEEAISALFIQVLALCAGAGLVKPGVIALDGTKIKASASLDANRSYASLEDEYREIARRWLDEADRVDAEEDELYGEDNNPYITELPEHLRDEKKRKAWIEEKLEQMRRQADEEEGRQQKKIEAYERKKEAGAKHPGRKPLPPEVARKRFLEKKKVNTTDLESRIMKGPKGYVQGYNAQIAVTEDQIIVASDLANRPDDWSLLHPMVELARGNLEQVGVEEKIGIALADAGYGSEENLAEAERLKAEAEEKGEPSSCPEFFVATEKDRILAAEMRKAEREARGESPKTEEEKTARARMKRKLLTEEGRQTYAKRGKTVEPVFGQIKDARRCERFARRGLGACRSEWKLMCLSHNVLKLWRNGVAVAEIG